MRKPWVLMHNRSSAVDSLQVKWLAKSTHRSSATMPQTVVRDLNQVDAPLGHLDIDASTAGIDGVLQEFLDHAGGPLDDFARGDSVDTGWWQLLDAGHAAPREDLRSSAGGDHRLSTPHCRAIPQFTPRATATPPVLIANQVRSSRNAAALNTSSALASAQPPASIVAVSAQSVGRSFSLSPRRLPQRRMSNSPACMTGRNHSA